MAVALLVFSFLPFSRSPLCLLLLLWRRVQSISRTARAPTTTVRTTTTCASAGHAEYGVRTRSATRSTSAARNTPGSCGTAGLCLPFRRIAKSATLDYQATSRRRATMNCTWPGAGIRRCFRLKAGCALSGVPRRPRRMRTVLSAESISLNETVSRTSYHQLIRKRHASLPSAWPSTRRNATRPEFRSRRILVSPSSTRLLPSERLLKRHVRWQSHSPRPTQACISCPPACPPPWLREPKNSMSSVRLFLAILTSG